MCQKYVKIKCKCFVMWKCTFQRWYSEFLYVLLMCFKLSNVMKQMSSVLILICVWIKRLITCENVQFTSDYFHFMTLKFEFTCKKKSKSYINVGNNVKAAQRTFDDVPNASQQTLADLANAYIWLNLHLRHLPHHMRLAIFTCKIQTCE